MDFEFLILWIVYSIIALVIFDAAEKKLTRLEEQGSHLIYEIYGKYLLGNVIILLPAGIGAAEVGLLFAHLIEVTPLGFIVACCIFATCLPVGGWAMFSSLRSVERITERIKKEEELTMEFEHETPDTQVAGGQEKKNKKYVLTDECRAVGDNDTKVYRIQALKSFGRVKEGDLGGFVSSEYNLSHEGDCWVFDDAVVCENATVAGNASVSNFAFVAGKADIWGEATVADYAKVVDDAEVGGSARIEDQALVQNESQVYQKARVSDNAILSDCAYVTGNAWVLGNANIQDDAKVQHFAQVSGEATVGNYANVRDSVRIKDDAKVLGCDTLRGTALVGKGALIQGSDDVFVVHPIGSESGTFTAYRGTDGSIHCTRGCFSGDLDEFSRAVTSAHWEYNPKVYEEYQLVIELVKRKFARSYY